VRPLTLAALNPFAVLCVGVLTVCASCRARSAVVPPDAATADVPPPAASAEPAPGDQSDAGQNAPHRATFSFRAPTFTCPSRHECFELVGWSSECEEAWRATAGFDGGVEVYPVDRHRVMLQVACAAGAYQGSQRFYILHDAPAPDEPQVRQLSVLTYESMTEGELVPKLSPEVWGRVDFDSHRRRLILLNVFRGLGDCGYRAEYEVTPRGLTLRALRFKNACDDVFVDPTHWTRLPVP
jgi:hypothetical protein